MITEVITSSFLDLMARDISNFSVVRSETPKPNSSTTQDGTTQTCMGVIKFVEYFSEVPTNLAEINKDYLSYHRKLIN